MSVDMREFYAVFFEEAGELLANMEQLLLGIDLASPDNESLNAVFRCAHSIKGGAATFAFTDVVEVTHVLESLLDQIRKGEKRLRSDMIDVFLAAGDVLKGQLAGHRGDGSADPAQAAAICAKLKAFVAETAGAVPAAPAAAAAPDAPAAPAAAPPAATTSAFQIAFRIDGEAQEAATLAGHVISGLGQLGQLAFSRGGPQGGERIVEDGKARQVYAATLATAKPEEDVWEVLAFNLDPALVSVTAAPAPPAVAPTPPPPSGEFGLFEQLYEKVLAPAPPAVPAPDAAQHPERRASDDPAAAAPRGRRESDKSGAAGSEAGSIRVNLDKVDHLINLVGELVIAHAMLAQSASKLEHSVGEALMRNVGQFERNMRDLQEAVMSIRMMPIGFVFSRFPRVVRDLAAKLGKQVELKTNGEGTELDKGLIEKISDPLTHLVRNSLDHGIESPAARVAAGKPERGTVTLSAFHQGGSIVIEVADDGAGLSRERILAKARERGLPVSDAMSDAEVWMLIFEAGFSTAAVVTDVSGRGVGMDVVRRNIQALGGSVEIDSALGVGTRMSIRVPLTLAILDGMSVAVGGQTFVVPLTAIVESLRPRREDLKTVQGLGEVVRVRGDYLPIVRLHRVFGMPSEARAIEDGIFVILEADGVKKAVLVDELLGQQQVVIKNLETNYRKIPGVAGATIMGDGLVALILDVGAIVRAQPPALRAVA